jgi:hypothetical protein
VDDLVVVGALKEHVGPERHDAPLLGRLERASERLELVRCLLEQRTELDIDTLSTTTHTRTTTTHTHTTERERESVSVVPRRCVRARSQNLLRVDAVDGAALLDGLHELLDLFTVHSCAAVARLRRRT